MKVIARTGNPEIATVYLAELRPSKYVEFVESVQPPIPRIKKWVLIVSTLFGCPIKCQICDAGGYYRGKLSKTEIFEQIDFLITRSFPDRQVLTEKFKIQFARMGEPSLNPAVLEVLKEFSRRYQAPGIIPSLSTVAPDTKGSDSFFSELIGVKHTHYSNGNFQLQFSIHTTDPVLRDQIIPVKKWSFEKIASYGQQFYQSGDRKITLNFALSEDFPLMSEILVDYFNPEIFLIKLTPVNPTIQVKKNKINHSIQGERQAENLPLVRVLRKQGYEVIVSIGEHEENKIGSNCGQFVKRFLDNNIPIQEESYSYQIEQFSGM